MIKLASKNQKINNKTIYKSSFIKEITKKKALYFMMLPGLLFLIIYYYLPMIGVVIAFQNFNPVKGIFHSAWVGFDNFKFFFTSRAMANVTFNTILYNVIFIISGIGLSLIIAVLFNETGSKSLSKAYKSILLVPYFMSWIVAQYIVLAFLDLDRGIINNFLSVIGKEKINWYFEPSYWRFIFPIAYVWKVIGYYSVIFVAGITGISKEYYEAAQLDGANKIAQIRYITIPLLAPIVIILLLLQTGKIFYGGLGDFGMFYTLTNNSGFLIDTTDVIDTYVLRALRKLNQPGMAAAVGLYQSLVGLILVTLSNYIIRKYDKESALF